MCSTLVITGKDEFGLPIFRGTETTGLEKAAHNNVSGKIHSESQEMDGGLQGIKKSSGN